MQELHREQNHNAAEWAKMLTAPSNFLCRAPSSTPFLASKTRFVRSVDIRYSDTDNGVFMVGMFPNAKNALGIGGPSTVIPSVPGPLVLDNFAKHVDVNASGYFYNAPIVASDKKGAVLGTTAFVDGSKVNVALSGIPVIPVNIASGAVIDYTATPVTHVTKKQYFKIGFVDSVAHTISWQPVKDLGSVINGTVTAGAAQEAIILAFVDKDGVLNNTLPEAQIDFTVKMSAGQIPSGKGPTSLALVKTQLMDQGKVGNQRCTAMSLFVTNMAPPLVSGGELVIGRVPIQVLESGSATDIMNTIKALPEEKYWRSGPIKDGGYAWWLPDDLASYEPTPLDTDITSENVLVAVGAFSDPGGYIRIAATWIFEFYTPVQLFSRDYNETTSPAHRDMWHMLSREPAVSANIGHLALLADLALVVKGVYDFYQSNRAAINKGANLVRQLVAPKPRRANNTSKPTSPQNNNNKKKKNRKKRTKVEGTGFSGQGGMKAITHVV